MYFESNLRVIDPRNISVSRRSSTIYAFNLTLHVLGPPQENIEFFTTWTARGTVAGNYTIGLSAFSDDLDVDPAFRSCEYICELQILEDVPVLSELILSPVYYSYGLDSQEMCAHPWQNIKLRCNISCPFGIKNVTLYYLMDSSAVWNQLFMTQNDGNQWMGTIPGQPEGKLVMVYVEAFSMSGKSSKTREYAYRVLDLQLLELRTKIVAGATAVTILVGVIGIFAWKKRKITEAL